MRPQGIIRVALRESATRLANERGGASWREIASAATIKVEGFERVSGEQVQRGVASQLARNTIKNMVRVGELVEIGRQSRSGSSHWEALYVPASMGEAKGGTDAAARSLGDLLKTWAR